MGELIDLAQRRDAVHRQARRREPLRAQLFFDLACPFTYLATERVQRAFPHVTWTAASAETLQRRSLADDPERVDRVRAAAERRAAELRMPLVWPDRFPAEVPAAMRAAAVAAEHGQGGAFVLAAGRLAFCGGFDLDDPEILAETAAAAGIPLVESFGAAGDTRRDGAAEAVGRRLLAAGADRLPVLRVGRSLFWGEQRVGAAAASVRQAAPALARQRGLTPPTG
jgi:2-hydroxychromene-2-carboxylate isomerase